MNDEPSSTKRRIYDFPVDLADRIIAYQKERSLPSEVEAVRRLLDQALKSHDTFEDIIGRYLDALDAFQDIPDAAAHVLVGHPHVRSIEFDEESIKVRLRTRESDETYTIQSRSLIEVGNPLAMDTVNLTYDQSKRRGSRLTEALPF